MIIASLAMVCHVLCHYVRGAIIIIANIAAIATCYSKEVAIFANTNTWLTKVIASFSAVDHSILTLKIQGIDLITQFSFEMTGSWACHCNENSKFLIHTVCDLCIQAIYSVYIKISYSVAVATIITLCLCMVTLIWYIGNSLGFPFAS